MTLTKEQFMKRYEADLKAKRIRAANDLKEYQCEARRRMKRLYRGTNLRTRNGVQINQDRRAEYGR